MFQEILIEIQSIPYMYRDGYGFIWASTRDSSEQTSESVQLLMQPMLQGTRIPNRTPTVGYIGNLIYKNS
jgi:hypothetical protein